MKNFNLHRGKILLIMMLCFLTFGILNLDNVFAVENIPWGYGEGKIPEPEKNNIIISNYFNVPKLGADKNSAGEDETFKNTVYLTNNGYYQFGVMWAKNKIDLKKDFSLEAKVYLYSPAVEENIEKHNIADGITFTIQNDKDGYKAYGQSGQGLGVYGYTKGKDGENVPENIQLKGVENALVFEMDTYYNYHQEFIQSENQNENIVLNEEFNNSRHNKYNGHIAVLETNSDICHCERYPERALMSMYHRNTIDGEKSVYKNEWQDFSVNWDSEEKIMTYKFGDFDKVEYYIEDLDETFGFEGENKEVRIGFTGSTGEPRTSYQLVSFEKLPEGPVTIKYIDSETGEEVCEKEVKYGVIGDPWSSEKKSIPGYKCTDIVIEEEANSEITVNEEEKTASGTYDWDAQTIVYKYEKVKIDICAEKTWRFPEEFDKEYLPSVKFELWRKVDAEEEKIEEEKIIDGDTTEVTWENLDESNEKGQEYIYFIKENFIDNSDKSNQNWETSEDGLKVTNELKSPSGKLTIKKHFENNFLSALSESNSLDESSENDPIEFEITVKGPYGYKEVLNIKAGESKTLENLYYGKYIIEETETHGYKDYYAIDDKTPHDIVTGPLELDLEEENKEFNITVLNLRDAEETNGISITIKKVWINDFATNPNTNIELWRSGYEIDGTEIDEKICEFSTEDELEKTYYNLSKHDPSGRKFIYRVEEPEVPTDYECTITGDQYKGFVVTNKYLKEETDPENLNPSEETEQEISWISGFSPQVTEKTKAKLNKEDHFAYMVGYPDGYFRPNGNITRGEVATIFFRMLTENSRNEYWSVENDFNDVNKAEWYNNAISTMAKAEVLDVKTGMFRPNDNMTRAELAVMMTKFFDESGVSTHNFTDIDGHWAESEIAKVAEKGWIKGYGDKTFRPDQALSRAETAKLINVLLERTPHKDSLLDEMKKWPDNSDKDKWYYADIQEATNSHEYERKDSNSKELWTKLLPVRDWIALEKEWSKANSSINPGEVK